VPKSNPTKSVLVLAAVVIGGWAWWSMRDQQFSERPAKLATAQQLGSLPSFLQIRAAISYAAIADALTKEVPATMSEGGRSRVCADLTEQVEKTVEERIGGDVGKLFGDLTKIVIRVVTVDQTRNVCQDVDYNYTVRRDGAVQVSRSATGLRLELPISADGRAGFSGDLARALAMDRKSFRGALTAIADITFGLDARWCPTLDAATGFRWRNKAELEVIQNVWLEIDGSVGPRIDQLMNEALAKMRASINCDEVRERVAAVWRTYSTPIQVPGGGPQAHLNIVPSGAAFSGVAYGDSGVTFALGFAGTTEVGTAPATSSRLPLPNLERIPVTSDRINLILPIRAGWAELSAAATAALASQEFTTDTPAGRATVVVDRIEIYPSGQRIALALHIAASVPGRLLDTRGWVYLTAEPTLDPATQTLRAQGLEMTRQLDNSAVSALSAVLRGPLQSFLESRAVRDLRPEIQRGREEMAGALARLTEQQRVVVSLVESFAGLQAIHVGDDFLTVVLKLEGTASVMVDGVSTPR
jgi:hypothetical protein